MSKVNKLSKSHLLNHVPTRDEYEDGNPKTKKSKKLNKNELSSKNRHGHFSKTHIWPFRNENKKGRKV